ncbi:MAG: hypothetical protein RMK99_06890 [Anaerolineales bacterium]|nr:hypothetical protein [Anaerolineales bacterium]
MRRPRRITFLCIILLGLSAYNLLGATGVYARWDFLSRLPLSAPPAYLLLRNGFWALVLAALAIALWRLWPSARRAACLTIPTYFAHGWFDRFVLAQADSARATWPWALAVDAVCLAVLSLLLSARDHR